MTQSLIDVMAEAIGYVLASQVSGNNMPDMSGDPRNRLPPHKRERFDKGCSEAARDVLQAIDRAGYKIVPEIRHESAIGRTIEEMRANISSAMLGAGDAKLMWINEGDLLMLYMPTAMLSASKEGITE